MLNRVKVSIVALVFTLGFAGAPAFAQPQAGLVNVIIGNINVVVPVQAAVNLAANVCGVQLTALAILTGQAQNVTCESKAQSGKQAQFIPVGN